VCAIVGGVLAQEMIKALTAKDEPFNNHFLYDGYHGNGTVELIG
jgi:ubiquitin-like 1-activating enzyme E1 A